MLGVILKKNDQDGLLVDGRLHLGKLVENAGDMVRTLTPEGILTYLSPNWLELMGEPASEESITGSVSAELIHFGDKEVIRCSIADITDRRRGEEALRVQTELFAAELERRVAERTARLKETNKELEIFAYPVSHDLRSTLRSLDGFSHIQLEVHGAVLDEEGKRESAVIRESADEM